MRWLYYKTSTSSQQSQINNDGMNEYFNAFQARNNMNNCTTVQNEGINRSNPNPVGEEITITDYLLKKSISELSVQD